MIRYYAITSYVLIRMSLFLFCAIIFMPIAIIIGSGNYANGIVSFAEREINYLYEKRIINKKGRDELLDSLHN